VISEKLTALARSALIYGLGNYGVKLVGFLLIPVYTRYLAPADYGVMSLVSTFGQALFIFLNLGQSTALFRFYYDDDTPQGRERVIAGSLWIVLVVSTPITLLALTLSKPTAGLLLGDSSLAWLVAIGILTVACRQLLRLPFAILRADDRDTRYATWSVLRTALSAGLAIVLVVGFHMGVSGVLTSQLVAEALCCVILVPPIARTLRAGRVGSEMRQQLTFGLALVPGAMAGFTLDLSDRFFLRHYSTLEEVGLYSLGYRLGEIIFFVVAAVQLAWPQFVYGNRKSPQAKELFSYAATYYLLGMLFCVLGLSTLAPELVRLMAAPEYHSAAPVVPLIALAGLCEGLRFVFTIGIAFQKRPLIRSAAMGAAALVNVGLNVLLIPRYGMMGAAWSTLVGFVTLISIEYVVSRRFYPVPYQHARFAKLAGVVMLLYVASGLVPPGAPVVVAAEKVALLLVGYPLLLWLARFFEPAEIEHVRRAYAGVRRRLVASRA
jgi:O-antigen/teichoic acid export membrane protein